MVLADTVKGKGVSFMEDVRSWHADAVDADQYALIRAELGADA
jgi:transketolase